MRSDSDIKQNVEAELRWTPEVEEKDIAVKVTEGTVTLTGFVHDFHQKYVAEMAVKAIKGVTAVANDIEVNLASAPPSDPEIARSAVAALQRTLPDTWEQVKPTVKHGTVCLEGEVEWHYESAAAEDAMRHLQGVTNVSNYITVKPSLPAQSVKNRIQESFRRMAGLDVEQISINTRGGQVTLRGKVRSWAERDAAERSAWSAPGVTRVLNHIDVHN